MLELGPRDSESRVPAGAEPTEDAAQESAPLLLQYPGDRAQVPRAQFSEVSNAALRPYDSCNSWEGSPEGPGGPRPAVVSWGPGLPQSASKGQRLRNRLRRLQHAESAEECANVPKSQPTDFATGLSKRNGRLEGSAFADAPSGINGAMDGSDFANGRTNTNRAMEGPNSANGPSGINGVMTGLGFADAPYNVDRALEGLEFASGRSRTNGAAESTQTSRQEQNANAPSQWQTDAGSSERSELQAPPASGEVGRGWLPWQRHALDDTVGDRGAGGGGFGSDGPPGPDDACGEAALGGRRAASGAGEAGAGVWESARNGELWGACGGAGGAGRGGTGEVRGGGGGRAAAGGEAAAERVNNVDAEPQFPGEEPPDAVRSPARDYLLPSAPSSSQPGPAGPAPAGAGPLKGNDAGRSGGLRPGLATAAGLLDQDGTGGLPDQATRLHTGDDATVPSEPTQATWGTAPVVEAAHEVGLSGVPREYPWGPPGEGTAATPARPREVLAEVPASQLNLATPRGVSEPLPDQDMRGFGAGGAPGSLQNKPGGAAPGPPTVPWGRAADVRSPFEEEGEEDESAHGSQEEDRLLQVCGPHGPALSVYFLLPAISCVSSTVPFFFSVLLQVT